MDKILDEPSTLSYRISNQLLKKKSQHIQFPTYDRTTLKTAILHIGVGGFHRSHQAPYIEDLIELHGIKNWAICGAGIIPQDSIIHKALNAQDCLYTLLERSAQINRARIIGSLKKYLFGCENPEAIFQMMTNPEIKIVTITATESGYYLHQGTGRLQFQNPKIQNDLHNLRNPQTIFGYLAESLDRRRKAGITPFTVLSCDNLQKNGSVTKKTLLTFCDAYNETLAKWIEKNVSFPNCMVDRITPSTTDVERKLLRDMYHLDDAFPVVAEPYRQWIIEDQFNSGRPPLEKVGVQFTTDVSPYEKMKIRLLNASHSAMGYLGYLCGYRYIDEIASVPQFVTYIKNLMDVEVTPLLSHIPEINLTQYKNTLMERFTNEAIKDHALRICSDGSVKIPLFILPSISEQLERGGSITRLTLCVASWMRFLYGKDECDMLIPIHDPQAEKLMMLVKKSKEDPRPLLKLTPIFGKLEHSKRFVLELERLLHSLYVKGARATLEECM